MAFSRRGFQQAFSFAEMMVVIGCLAILVGIGIPTILNVVPASKASIADANLQKLNQAVIKYNNAVKELEAAPSGNVESTIVTTLKTRDLAVPGSPFLEPSLKIVTDGTSETYRASWNGRMFELIEPGSTGDGVDLMRMTEGNAND